MGGFPIVAWLLTKLAGEPGRFVFVMEALGLVGFVVFWVFKSFELKAGIRAKETADFELAGIGH